MARRSITSRVIRNARRRGVKIYGRRAWRCPNKGVYAWRRVFRKHKRVKSDTLWQHMSVTHVEPIRKAMRTLHRIGMERFGSGVSYNFAIHPHTGQVGLGQSLDAAGTHTLNDKGLHNFSFNQNYVAHAFCLIGMPGERAKIAAVEAMGKLMAAMYEEGALTIDPDYEPHNLVAWKSCPDSFQPVMDDVWKVFGREIRNPSVVVRKRRRRRA